MDAAGPADQSGADAEIAALLAGDEAAFRAVYRSVQPGLVRYLSVLVGGGPASGTEEDLASETWAQVCRDLHRFHGGADGFRAWVFTIARHRALDALRTLRRRGAVLGMDIGVADGMAGRMADGMAGEGGTPGAFASHCEQVEQAAAEAAATRAALALIRTLPPDQAEAVMLRVIIGLDAVSAARVLGKRPGAVRTAAHRGLKALAARVSDTFAPLDAGAVR